MKIAVRIFFIFALLFVLAGAGCMGAGFLLGGSFAEVQRIGGEIPINFWKNHAGRMVRIPFVSSVSKRGSERAEGIRTERAGYVDVENLYIDVAAGYVEISEGDGEEILVDSSSDNAKVKLEDGTLTVQDNWEGWFADEPVTKVEIPKGYAFKKVTLCGTGAIECSDLTADVVDIEANAADISVDGRLQAKEKLEIKANAANISIDRAARAPKAILNANLGDIDVAFEGSRSDYAISTQANLGDITVDGGSEGALGESSTGRIEAKSNLGNIHIAFEK